MTHLSPTYLCSAADSVSQCRSVLDLQEHGNVDPKPCAPSDRLQEKKKGEFLMWHHPLSKTAWSTYHQNPKVDTIHDIHTSVDHFGKFTGYQYEGEEEEDGQSSVVV